MIDMLLFVLYITLASIEFGFAAKDLHEKRYVVFGFGLTFGIIFVFSAAALFISHAII